MTNSTGANPGFEEKIRMMADGLRGTMNSIEHKPVVLGLIFYQIKNGGQNVL